VSVAVDVNILLYASDETSGHYTAARSALDRIVSDGDVCCLAWITIASYLRMATHPRIFNSPLSQTDAELNMGRLLALPRVRAIAEQEGFWGVYKEVTGTLPVRGNLVPDAHLAAILKQHGIRTLYTHDRDFLKFTFLRVVDPIA